MSESGRPVGGEGGGRKGRGGGGRGERHGQKGPTVDGGGAEACGVRPVGMLGCSSSWGGVVVSSGPARTHAPRAAAPTRHAGALAPPAVLHTTSGALDHAVVGTILEDGARTRPAVKVCHVWPSQAPPFPRRPPWHDMTRTGSWVLGSGPLAKPLCSTAKEGGECGGTTDSQAGGCWGGR